MDNNKHDKGFSLLEISVVLVIVGIFIGFAIRLILPGLDYMRVSQTQERLEKVTDRLAAFVIKNNRLPCSARPDGGGAEPFGFERGSGANGDDSNTVCYDDDAEGIIPFMTLGLPQEQIEDG